MSERKRCIILSLGSETADLRRIEVVGHRGRPGRPQTFRGQYLTGRLASGEAAHVSAYARACLEWGESAEREWGSAEEQEGGMCRSGWRGGERGRGEKTKEFGDKDSSKAAISKDVLARAYRQITEDLRRDFTWR